MKNKENLWPAALYVEGSDQFRGWFNSSLITSVILANNPPYQQVLSHGFVVDEKGHKMSKSLGNVIDPEELLKKYGADILRLWVVSSDFTKEVKVSESILTKIQESYQKIRNTLRFLLGNLAHLPSNFHDEKNLTGELELIDYYTLQKLDQLIKESQENYKEYNFNIIYQNLLSFCINNLSSLYFEISKDSLYCDSLNSLRRRQIITVLYYLLRGLLKIITPILPFLAEEIYQHIPFKFELNKAESVHLVKKSFNLPLTTNFPEEIKLITDFFLPLRQNVYQTLEKARREKIIDNNLQAQITIYIKGENKWDYAKLNFEELFLVSKVHIKKEENQDNNSPIYQNYDLWNIKVTKADKGRCLRCWNYRDLVQDFCYRCQKNLDIN